MVGEEVADKVNGVPEDMVSGVGGGEAVCVHVVLRTWSEIE